MFSSTFILKKPAFSPYSSATASTEGAIIRHGPHHSAQKSTRIGFSLPKTSFSKLLSDISLAKFAISISYVLRLKYSEALSNRKIASLKPPNPATVTLKKPASLCRGFCTNKCRIQIDRHGRERLADRTTFLYVLGNALKFRILDAVDFGFSFEIDTVDLETRLVLT